jgi:hypothetical protein
MQYIKGVSLSGIEIDDILIDIIGTAEEKVYVIGVTEPIFQTDMAITVGSAIMMEQHHFKAGVFVIYEKNIQIMPGTSSGIEIIKP